VTGREPPSLPLRPDEYYFENGFLVFTEVYHLRRGRCCGNACRHCPYEHANVPRPAV
jgi:hypothetical protein